MHPLSRVLHQAQFAVAVRHEGGMRQTESLGEAGLVRGQQIVELVLSHRCDEPSLEARAAGAFSSGVIDGRRERDEAMCPTTRLPLKRARKLVGVSR